MPLTLDAIESTRRPPGPPCSACVAFSLLSEAEREVLDRWLTAGQTHADVARAITRELGARLPHGRVSAYTLGRHLRGECSGASH